LKYSRGLFSPQPARGARTHVRGQALVEFALLALALYVLLAGSIEVGRMVFTAQALQDAARVAARELAVTPLPAAITFEEALQQPEVIARVFDPSRLVIDLDSFADDNSFDAYMASLPLVNQALRPLMILDFVKVGGTERRLLRYPGALLSDPSAPTGFSVGIPRVTARDADGVEMIEWIPILSEARTNPADPTTGPFSLASASPQAGVAAVVINYPFQAAMLSGFRSNPAGPLEPNIGNVIVADDSAVTETNAPPSGTVQPLDAIGPYAGDYGLGHQLAFAGQTVRPYRKLLAGQAIFRREVIQ